MNSCIAGHIRVDHWSGGPAGRVTIFAVFRGSSHNFVDVCAYGNYFAADDNSVAYYIELAVCRAITTNHRDTYRPTDV